MELSDMKGFCEFMVVVGEIYSTEINEVKIQVYFNCLKIYNIEQIKEAFNTHIKNSKYFPKPSEIIEYIEPKKDIEVIVNKAWLKLLKGIDKYGYYDSVVFDDPVIHSCINAMGGWMKVSDREQDTWMHKDFAEFYKSYKDKLYHHEKVCGAIELQSGRYEIGYIGEDDKIIKLKADLGKDKHIWKIKNL